jgi:hypothetical protein
MLQHWLSPDCSCNNAALQPFSICLDPQRKLKFARDNSSIDQAFKDLNTGKHMLQVAGFQSPHIRTIVSESCGAQVSTLPDGTIVHLNSDGQIIQAQYPSGMKLKCNDHSCLVQTVEGCYWYRDCNLRWYALD